MGNDRLACTAVLSSSASRERKRSAPLQARFSTGRWCTARQARLFGRPRRSFGSPCLHHPGTNAFPTPRPSAFVFLAKRPEAGHHCVCMKHLRKPHGLRRRFVCAGRRACPAMAQGSHVSAPSLQYSLFPFNHYCISRETLSISV